MHAKSDSEVTSLAPSSPPRSPRRPIYYVMSPMSQHETEKMSMGSSPPGSPYHHHGHHHHGHHPHHHRYASSPIHHSRESSTTRFSASLRNGPWRKFPYTRGGLDEEEDEEGDDGAGRGVPPRCYAVFFLLGFVTLFTVFSLVLWGASKVYSPDIFVKSVVFESYNLHPGMDWTGVPTKMLSINSTVKVSFRNPATFFGVHVSSTPLELYYYELVLASGNMKEFYQSRKSQRVVTVRVGAQQVPVYGGGSTFTSVGDGEPPANIPLNLTFVMRARAHVLGKLVKSKFYRRIRCLIALREAHLGKPLDLGGLCAYSS
ncbi:hypothetical protein Taro_025872 [Colocasia esculenta]|uniref:Late embryogenesis abundant protein LEA-2 subgroup domain-containing protein n=1 Tax=Colocasia esculenta TaxID=4460 RepID=A0A843VIW2_COLES|nr:hypothetical protein [Colocasia esculenta]